MDKNKIKKKMDIIRNLKENKKIILLSIIHKVLPFFLPLGIILVIFHIYFIGNYYILVIPEFFCPPLIVVVALNKIEDVEEKLLDIREKKIKDIISFEEFAFYYKDLYDNIKIDYDWLSKTKVIFNVNVCEQLKSNEKKIICYSTFKNHCDNTNINIKLSKENSSVSIEIEYNLVTNIGKNVRLIIDDFKNKTNSKVTNIYNIYNDSFMEEYINKITNILSKRIEEDQSLVDIDKCNKILMNVIEKDNYSFKPDTFESWFVIKDYNNKLCGKSRDIKVICDYILEKSNYKDNELQIAIINILSKKIFKLNETKIANILEFEKQKNKIKASTNIHNNEDEYINHCWKCGGPIDSSKNRQCEFCGWYICNKCGACSYECFHTKK